MQFEGFHADRGLLCVVLLSLMRLSFLSAIRFKVCVAARSGASACQTCRRLESINI